jgi:CheY-like chemotaxis protein
MGAQTILLVEDEILIRILLADTLREAGYEVVEAANADEALVVLLSHSDLDLVITDVRMPGKMDGLQLTTYWKRLHPTRPAIVVSGHLQAGQAGPADAFLPKPFSDGALLETVGKLIGPPWKKDSEDRTAS